MIEIQELTFKYNGAKKNALEKISLEIEKGGFVGIIGESGAGKTTFVDILLGLLPPVEGSIYVDGVELTQTLNGTMTFVTVTQNLLIGAYQDSDETKGRFWKGTVNRCAVWIDKVLNANEMSEVLS